MVHNNNYFLCSIKLKMQNQTNNVDQGIEDALDHFAIEPKKCLANPSDVPFFLSVRIVDDEVNSDVTKTEGSTAQVGGPNGLNYEDQNENGHNKNPINHIYQYEQDAAKFAREFEENMVRF